MKNFSELNISEPILRAITELGFNEPSPIQAETLPILLGEGTDFLGLAATGTGKTGAFAIPLLEKMDVTKRGIQALILCPTRELAIQVAGQIALIGKYKDIKALPVYGGTGYADQIYGLKRGIPIVVGTPGRVIDHMEKGTLDLSNLQTLILDEADEMISMGFKDAIESILSAVPEGQAQTWLFSATMSPDVRKVANKYLKSPAQVQVNRTEMLPDTVEQIYYITQESNKPEVLCKLVDAAEDFYGIVFCQTKALVVDLHQYLLGRGYRTDCLHGDMDQNSRDRTMRGFREKKISILVATDVACRGLDVNDITHVVNYSIPRELDNYVHRIGRTGRIGKSGLAFSLVTNSHRMLIGRIERMTKTRMKEGTIPTRKDIGLIKVAKSLSTFKEQPVPTRVVELMDADWKAAIADMSKEEITGRFLGLMLPEVFALREQPEARSEEREPRGDMPDSRDERAPRGGYGTRDRGSRESWGSRDNRGPRDSRDDRAPRDFRGPRPMRDVAPVERPRRPTPGSQPITITPKASFETPLKTSTPAPMKTPLQSTAKAAVVMPPPFKGKPATGKVVLTSKPASTKAYTPSRPAVSDKPTPGKLYNGKSVLSKSAVGDKSFIKNKPKSAAYEPRKWGSKPVTKGAFGGGKFPKKSDSARGTA